MAVFKADSHPDLLLLPGPETRPAPSHDKAQQTPRAGTWAKPLYPACATLPTPELDPHARSGLEMGTISGMG